IQFYNGDGGWQTVIGTVDVIDGGWHHIVVTVGSSGTITIYVDNEVDNSGANGVMSSGNSNILCGAYGGSQKLTGSLDQIYIYDAVISADDV
ncbi:unnamed protein product, partial [marine sediment metagenome]